MRERSEGFVGELEEFWDIKAREEHARRFRKQRKEGLERAINLGKRAIQLQNQPGYQDFQKALADVHKHVVAQMVAHTGEDSALRVLQGKAQGLEDVMKLCSQSEKAVETLEAQLEAMQNEEAALPPREREPETKA